MLQDKYEFCQSDHFITQVNDKRKIVLHFYVKRVSYEQFLEIERQVLNSHDWGTEVAGICRPPLYQFEDTKDGKHDERGFEKFLKNQFIGTSAFQLLRVLHHCKIFSKNDILKLF
jgi:hypothetical protein